MQATKLVAVTLAVATLLATCAHTKPTRFANEKDPLLAMPSDSLHYVEERQPAHNEEATSVEHVEMRPQQQVSHYETRLVQVNPSEEHEQGHQVEYVQVSGPQTGEVSREYPGEILYLNQNNEVVGTSGRDQAANNHGHDLSQVVGAISQASGLAATILTEVPIKDMPQEVLERLKREYGVKVVATRDRPGANLVINCDDYAYQEGSICSRQSASEQQPGPVMSSYSYLAPEGEDPTATYTLSEQSNSAAENPAAEYEAKEAAAHPERLAETYGERNSAVGEEQREPRVEAEQGGATQGEQAQVAPQPEGGEQQAGFDEQPKNSEEDSQQQAAVATYNATRKS